MATFLIVKYGIELKQGEKKKYWQAFQKSDYTVHVEETNYFVSAVRTWWTSDSYSILSFQMSAISACIWATALKLSCVANFDMLFIVIGLIWLVDKINFLLISSNDILDLNHIYKYISV